MAVESRVGWRRLLPLPRFTAFQHRDYRLWWVSSLTGGFSMSTSQVAMSWLALQLTGTDARWIGGVIAAFGVPAFLFTIPAGVIADKWDRRFQAMASQTAALIIATAFAVLVALELATPQLTLVFAFLSGTSMVFGQPARQALIPMLVPREQLMNGVVLGSMANNTSRMVGPAIAGGLIAISGVASAFYVLAALLLIGLVALVFMRVPEQPADPQEARPEHNEGVFKSLAGGAIFLWHTKPLLVLMGMMVAIGLFIQGPIQSLAPVMVEEVWNVGASGLGLVFMVQGFAAIVASLYLTGLSGMKDKGSFAAFSMVFFSAFLVAFALMPIFWVALLIFFVRGYFAGIFANMQQTLLQTHSPRHVQGRVLSLSGLTIQGFVPLGALQAGFVASLLGAPAAMALGATIPLALGVLILLLARSFNRLS